MADDFETGGGRDRYRTCDPCRVNSAPYYLVVFSEKWENPKNGERTAAQKESRGGAELVILGELHAPTPGVDLRFLGTDDDRYRPWPPAGRRLDVYPACTSNGLGSAAASRRRIRHRYTGSRRAATPR